MKNLVMNDDVVICRDCYTEMLEGEDTMTMCSDSTEPCTYCGVIPDNNVTVCEATAACELAGYKS